MFANAFSRLEKPKRGIRMRLSLCKGMGGELEVAELLGLPLSCDNIVCVDNDPEVLDYLVKRLDNPMPISWVSSVM